MVHVDTDALRRFGSQFETEVRAKLGEAGTALQEAQSIEYSSFATVHIPLAAVYVEAWNLHNRDLETKRQTATEFKDRLDTTATQWEQAEQASTIRQEGGR